MDTCRSCGEPLEPGELCAVCLFVRGIDAHDDLPDTIGRYTIVRLVGEGGMGTVYEAVQDQPRRTVALKIIRTAYLTREVLRRFERESQALARLHHPGIAQVYEAGSEDNGFETRPYFAMEFVKGQRLDEYAKQSQLDTRHRLELMVRICEAVQHAHERGIIHRDLKPGNILVDDTGQPKILDFGVARITDADAQVTRQTDIGQVIGTLAYISPEQVLGDPLEIDTRSDVYSLGVILYQLLSGGLPYEVTGHLQEAVRVIREQDPFPLSSINRHYRGDIETIVGKALEKDKSRRYASAADLSADIKRYLEHQPIAARPPGAAYQLGKFARRHRTLVAGIAGIFLALVAGIIASTMEANRARVAERSAMAAQQSATKERDRAVEAERLAEQARRKAAQSAIEASNGRDQALRQQQRADTEAATATAISDFLRNDVLAQAGIGEQAGPNNKPDPDLKIRTALDRAAARIDGKFTGKPMVEASIRQTIGASYEELGLYEEAQRQLERALDIRVGTLGPDHPDSAEAMSRVASLFVLQGKYPKAEDLFTRALTIDRRALGKQSPAALAAESGLADTYRLRGDYVKPEPLFLEVLDAQRRLLGEDHPSTISTMAALGNLYGRQGKHSKSAELLVHLLEIARRKFGEEHPTTLMTMNDLANAYLLMGDPQFDRAEQLYRHVYEVNVRLLGEQHPSTVMSLSNLSTAYIYQKKYEPAERTFARVMELANRVFGPDHPRTYGLMGHQGDLYASEGKSVLAEQIYLKVVEGRRRLLGPRHPDTIKVMVSLARVRIDLKKWAEAEPLIRETMAAHEKLPVNSTLRFNDQVMLGRCLAGEGRFVEAEPLLLAGYEGLTDLPGDAPNINRSYRNLAGPWIEQLYRDWGKPDAAAKWEQKLKDTKVASAVR